MTVGAALLLIAAGAVLRFAVSTVSVYGINLHTIGIILMLIGLAGLALWLVVWAPWARSRRSGDRENAPYERQHPVPPYQEQRHTAPYPDQRPALPYPERRQVPPVDARTRDLYRADDPYYQDR